MQDTYLLDIKRRVQTEKLEIGRLEQYKESLRREINNLRTEKNRVKREFTDFTLDQMNYSDKKIKESRDKMQIEIDNHKNEIRIINNRAIEVGKNLELVSLRLKELAVKEKILKRQEGEIEKHKVKFNMLFERVGWAAELVGNEGDKVQKERKKNAKISKEIEEKLQKINKYEKEKRGLIREKEYILDGQYRILKVQKELMNDGIAWVKDQEIRIKAQWESLLLAKKYIEEHGGSK